MCLPFILDPNGFFRRQTEIKLPPSLSVCLPARPPVCLSVCVFVASLDLFLSVECQGSDRTLFSVQDVGAGCWQTGLTQQRIPSGVCVCVCVCVVCLCVW